MTARRAAVLFLLCALRGGPTLAEAAASEERLILRVRVVDRKTEIAKLAALDLDLAGVDVKADAVDFVGDRETYETLLAGGWFPEIVARGGEPSTAALSQYLDPAEVAQRVDLYASSYPTLAKKIAIATTAEGRIEWALKISDNVDLDEDEPAILYVGQHHAREVMTTEITLDIADYLLTRYASDPWVHHWVDEREIWIVPSHNPDGANTVFTSIASWRKNRRKNGGSSFGVDLNRNYPSFWGFCSSGDGASSAPSSDTYRGPFPASEPETQGLIELARAQRPVASLSYHTYGELVLHPYGCIEAVSGELRYFRDTSSDLAALSRNDAGNGWYSNGTPWELLYEVSGEADEWLYGELGVMTTTIEASAPGRGFQPDYDTWRASTVTRNRPAWQYLLDRIDGPSIWGHVVDACTGAPLSATVAIDEIVLANGEAPRTSEPLFGRYQHLTVPGSYHLRVGASGHGTQVRPVEVGFSPERREVRLAPTGAFAVVLLDGSVQDAAGDGDGQLDPGETVALSLTVTASGGALSALTAHVATTDPYVTILDADAAWPALAAGESASSIDGFVLAVSPAVRDGDSVELTVTFDGVPALCDASQRLVLPVDTHAPDCPAVLRTLDSDPSWTIENTDPSGWAFGPPASGAVAGPTRAPSGVNVYGTNLQGSYGLNVDHRLVTEAFDLTDLRNTELRFWRWLDNEAGYDIASVEVSTDGVTFTSVWSGFGRDTEWAFYRYDISALADGQATVYIRFRLRSDSSTVFAGFYIDDVSICGDSAHPAARLVVDSWSASDDGDAACTDHDSFADGGEGVRVTVAVRNAGNVAASAVVARLTSSDSRVGMAVFRDELGALAPGAVAIASFLVTVPSGLGCLSSVPLRVDLESDAGAVTAFDEGFALATQGDPGTVLSDVVDGFEAPSGWTLTGEWQIGAPQGRGGAGNGGAGLPDPTFATSGANVLGIDLTGLGSWPGNYENGLATPSTATSPFLDCSASTSVELRFRRWLGSERSGYDQATIDAWDGQAWRPVWQNPDTSLSDASWQSVSYDVTPWAAGNPAFRVRFKTASDGWLVYCGWNIDDLQVVRGSTPPVCEAAPCGSGCTPTVPAEDLRLDRAGDAAVLSWAAASDPCRAGSGAVYRVYRAGDPGPRVPSPSAWPEDSWFTDVTASDLDGTSADASFLDGEVPPSGGVFFYLVVPIGTDGHEGPSGWQGL